MRKISPEYSRKLVNKAGDILIAPNALEGYTFIDYVNAIEVLDNWRASHNYPLNTFQANIRTKIRRARYRNAIVAQRLKRSVSILDKLKREPRMRLSTMQDIGGIRAIVGSLAEALELADSYRNSRFSHELIKEYDYIDKPKASGYRSVHFVYRYKNRLAPEYDGLKIELQIRNRLQHSWATAVEVVGVFVKASLKSSEGPVKWLEFFQYVSAAFARMENCAEPEAFIEFGDKELLQRITDLKESLSVVKRLKAYNLALDELGDNRNFKYFLLHLIPNETRIRYRGFPEAQLDLATKEYSELERRISESEDQQAVLISGVTFRDLSKAYPNYFLDTSLFLKNLAKVEQQMG